MAKLIPFIRSEDAKAQAAFYKEALGGEILAVTTGSEAPNMPPSMKETVMHLSMVAAGVTFYLTECGPGPSVKGNEVTLSLEFATEAEVQAAFDKLAQGAEVHQPLHQSFWGQLYCVLKDKYGINWTLACELGDRS